MKFLTKFNKIFIYSFILLSVLLTTKAQTAAEDTDNFLKSISYLKNLKISGYLQAQYQHTESASGFGLSPYISNEAINDQFQIRRGRLKFDYITGITQMTIQGDFATSGVYLKEAYLKITEPWAKVVSLHIGVFSRPNFEVEYSPSRKECMESSTVIRTLYPGEQDLGAMFTIQPHNLFKLQLAGFNNTYQGVLKQNIPNYKYEPFYFMGRITKELEFKEADMKLNFGVNGRLGRIEANTNKIIYPENNNQNIDSVTYNIGDKFNRNWFGAELQYYTKILGGLNLYAEYMMGNNVYEETPANNTSIAPVRLTEFIGYYVMLAKPITPEWEVVGKYDYYAPNSKIAEENINTTRDLAVSTLGYGINNYSFQNIKISLWYDMNFRQTTENYPEVPAANVLTLRLQYKF